jgi:hypothetical protein
VARGDADSVEESLGIAGSGHCVDWKEEGMGFGSAFAGEGFEYG